MSYFWSSLILYIESVETEFLFSVCYCLVSLLSAVSLYYALNFFHLSVVKPKVITLTNHNSRKQSNETIRAWSINMSPVPSAGKHVQVNPDWFWFYF